MTADALDEALARVGLTRTGETRTIVKRSTGRRLHVVDTEQGPVVAKSLFPHEGTPRSHAAAVEELATLFSASSDVAAPPCLGWLDEPPLILIRYVAGRDLNDTLRSPLPAGTDTISGSLRRAAGGAARYHLAKPIPEGAASRTLARLRRRALFLGVPADLIVDRQDLVGRYGDLGPGNLRTDVQGRVWFLDPPPTPLPGSRYDDLAALAFGVDKELSRTAPTPPPLWAVDVITRGYEAVARMPLDRRRLLAAIAVRARTFAVRRLRRNDRTATRWAGSRVLAYRAAALGSER